jgi:hypothetical protein
VQASLVLCIERLQLVLLMIAGIVDDHRQPSVAAILLAEKRFEEVVKGHPVKLPFVKPGAKAAVSNVDGAPIANLLSSRSRRNLRLGPPRPPHPHHAGSLLEVYFILRPDADVRLAQQCNQFF